MFWFVSMHFVCGGACYLTHMLACVSLWWCEVTPTGAFLLSAAFTVGEVLETEAMQFRLNSVLKKCFFIALKLDSKICFYFCLTFPTLSNNNGLFHSLFGIKLKSSVEVKRLIFRNIWLLFVLHFYVCCVKMGIILSNKWNTFIGNISYFSTNMSLIQSHFK